MRGYSAKTIVCGRCSARFERYHSAQKLCPTCAPLAKLERQRKASARYRIAGGDAAKKRANELRRSRYAATIREKNLRRLAEYRADPAFRKANVEYGREWRKRNKARSRALGRASYERNRERILAQRRAGEWRKARRAREADRRKRDPGYAVERRMAAAVRSALRRRGSRTFGKKWEAAVGYTLADLVLHLERQFAKGMSWDNMEEWHIDHILPASSFAFCSADDPEFRACWSLTNLRPCWAGENHKKHAKRLFLI